MAPIHFGSLVFPYQTIDVIGPLDLLNSGSKELLKAASSWTDLDDKLMNRAPDFVFHHISETLEPVTLPTCAVTLTPTDTVDDCPELDCLLVGGSFLSYKLPPKYIEFIKRHVAAGKLLFTNCTGAAHVAATGVLDGKNATVNNHALDWVKKEYPDVKWTKDTKWVVDGNIWTGGGAVAGMDMFAHWMKESFGEDILAVAVSGIDFEPRDINGSTYALPKVAYQER